ncbi:MAG: hypothetical protein KKB02_08970 [Alphaproteobacteria bacterium]|nr:hypothetical protein [Alphaproteobacteria bacterium]
MTTGKLSQLNDVTDAVFLAEQAKLARITRREADLRHQLDTLLHDRSAVAHSARSADDAALAAGADVRWHQWIATRQTRLNAELLQVIALKGHQMDRVRKAHGRTEALRHLTLRTKAKDQHRKAARQERDG